jgi:glycosyltransferase involved in cell wall biosynthesis
MTLSVVVPVYKNEAGIDALLEALAQLHHALGGRMEAVLVVDGSPDRCYELLRDRLPGQPFRSQLLLHSRNFGSFPAIRSGLEAATGERFAVMAADLQEPPELVVQMNTLLESDEADVVIGTRQGRADPFASRMASAIFWSLYRRYVVPEMPPGGVDVFACNRAFRDELLKMQERHSSLVAQIFWLGFRRASVPYMRVPRRHGVSAWTLHRKLAYMMDSVFSFTDLPIRLLIRVGAAATILSGIFGAVVVVARLTGHITVPGYAMTILTLIFFGALNLFALGIVGSYAWRTYENSKARPLQVVLRRHNWTPT